MSKDSNVSSSASTGGGIGFCGLLTILFVGLKLGHIIDWSWWWVLSPLWIPVAIVLAILLAVGVVWLVAATVLGLITMYEERNKRR